MPCAENRGECYLTAEDDYELLEARLCAVISELYLTLYDKVGNHEEVDQAVFMFLLGAEENAKIDGITSTWRVHQVKDKYRISNYTKEEWALASNHEKMLRTKYK